MESKKKTANSIIKIILLAASVLASIKMILVGYNQDEEYQIVMAYRNIMGDRLFAEMWEPHQMSAFLTAILMRPFLWITGTTTGVVVYLRTFGVLIQLLVSALLYRILVKRFDKETAFLITVVFFNSTPKMFAGPEFSNMQFWALTLSLMLFYLADIKGTKSRIGIFYLILTAGALSAGVLSYPSMVIEAIAFIICICAVSKKDERAWNSLWLILSCVFFGILYCAGNIINVGADTFFKTIRQIPDADLTHSVSMTTMGTSKLTANVTDLLLYGGLTAAVFFATWLIFKIRKEKVSGNPHFASTALVISLFIPLGFWLVGGSGYEEGLVNITVSFAGLFILLHGMQQSERKFFIVTLTAVAMTVVSVLILTDMTFYSTIGHGVVIVTAFLIALCMRAKEDDRRFVRTVLIIICFFTVFSRGFMLRGGKDRANILGVENVCRTGPAAGIFTDYMRAYILDSNFTDWNDNVEAGDDVLIVTNTLFSNITTSYLVNDANVSHYSVINPAAYDERLLEYWEKYPEKFPDVIAVDCWYGEPLFPGDSWIMKFISEDYGYTEVCDGKYLRFYKK